LSLWQGKRQEARGKSEEGLGDFTFLYTVWFYCVHLLNSISVINKGIGWVALSRNPTLIIESPHPNPPLVKGRELDFLVSPHFQGGIKEGENVIKITGYNF
jgi:hypothetical protein